MVDLTLLTTLETGVLNCSWDHEIHVQASWEALHKYGLENGPTVIYNLIKHVNEARSASPYFNVTLTLFWAYMICEAFDPKETNFKVFWNRNPHLQDRTYHYMYYTKACIKTQPALITWVSPDIKDLNIKSS